MNTGILDIERKNNNPLTDQPYSKESTIIYNKVIQLPIFKKHKEFLNNFEKNRVTLIQSSTGSGKSVVAGLLIAHYYNYKEKIAMTLPKQIITQSLAEYIAKIMDVPLGKQIGYKYKGSPSSSTSKDTLILYATDGTIVNKLLQDPSLLEYKCIIIDEAHERKVQIDFLLYLLKNTLKLREDFKLVIMSATINEQIFKSYFDSFTFNIMDISSKSNYEVKSIYSPKPIEEYMLKSYKIILDIVKANEPGDILVFVTSVKETEELCETINKNEDLSSLFCIELYSGLPDEKQEMAKNKELYKSTDKTKTRKIVIATEVAESSITIDGVIFIIDCGKALLGGYHPAKRARTLDKAFITQSQIKQRKGRTGRTEPGICYHLYTEKEFNELIEYPEPAIRKSNIYDECLKLMTIPHISHTKDLLSTLSQFIEPPGEAYISSAMMQLNELNLIEDHKLSSLGKIVSEFKTDIPISIALYYAYLSNCSHEVSKIAALINASKGLFSNIFVTPNTNVKNEKSKERARQLKAKIDKIKRAYVSSSGDFISMYKIYHKAEKAYADKKLFEFARENFMKYKTLEKAIYEYRKMRQNIYKVAHQFQLKTDPNLDKNLSIRKRVIDSLYQGFKNNTCKLHGNDTYMVPYSKSLVKIGQESLMNLCKSLPKQIFYGEFSIVLGTEKLNMICKIK